jgi:hypothetical protein
MDRFREGIQQIMDDPAWIIDPKDPWAHCPSADPHSAIMVRYGPRLLQPAPEVWRVALVRDGLVLDDRYDQEAASRPEAIQVAREWIQGFERDATARAADQP